MKTERSDIQSILSTSAKRYDEEITWISARHEDLRKYRPSRFTRSDNTTDESVTAMNSYISKDAG